MAVNDVKAANVTKFDTGGGDNYIPDGYIKTVEKIWADNYTLTSVITLTNTSIIIARIPENKKIMDIQVSILTTLTQTSGTISLGHSGDENAFIPAVDVTHNLTLSTLAFPTRGILSTTAALSPTTVSKHSGFQMVTSGTTGNITLKLNNWIMTTGTIKTVVRYT